MEWHARVMRLFAAEEEEVHSKREEQEEDYDDDDDDYADCIVPCFSGDQGPDEDETMSPSHRATASEVSINRGSKYLLS